MIQRRALMFFGLLLFLLAVGCKTTTTAPQEPPPPVDPIQQFREAFAQPQLCATCHPNHVQEWQSSMHAYAFTDPVFFSLHDIGQAGSNNGLGQFCVKCHSPMAPFLQETPPGFDPNAVSALSKNAIHCDVCHTMASFERGKGITAFHLDRVRRGPIADPLENTFHESQLNPDIFKSDFCSPCHNVLSPDETLFLESTSTEWEQSPYIAMGLECQGCHMPAYEGQAATGGPQRTVHRHTFTGVDYPLTPFPDRDLTIQRVRELLQNAVSLTVTVPAQVTAGQPIEVEVKVTNDRTGHDIPSGTIFERQMWVELIVRDAATQAVYFSSGLLDGNGDLLNHHSEEVANGTAPPDSALTLFNGTPIKQNGQETLFFWEAHSIRKNTIPAFQSAISRYHLRAPGQPATLEVLTRLRFRSFPPYLLRAAGQDALISSLIIFDMNSDMQSISVVN